MSERNITFEIKEHLGVIAEFDNGWNKEPVSYTHLDVYKRQILKILLR